MSVPGMQEWVIGMVWIILNDTAIGIETVNLATDNDGVFTFPPYNVTQIAAIKALASNILYRFPDITPVNVVGHSDIAPGRKSDPGAAFPWKALYDAGIGAWYDDETKQRYLDQFLCSLPSKNDIISKLKRYGYDTSGAVSEVGYNQLIRASNFIFGHVIMMVYRMQKRLRSSMH